MKECNIVIGRFQPLTNGHVKCINETYKKYGDLIIDVPEYGSYKLRFVSNVKETAEELMDFLCGPQITLDL